MAPRYSDPAYGPASAGSPADFPNAGFLGPMSYGAMAPPAPGAIPAAGYSSGMMDAMQNTSFRDEAIGPVSREAGAPRSPMRLLIQVAIIVLMAMLTFLLGAIIYYAVNESSPSPSVAADTTPPVISSTSVSSIGDTGATITWKTDEPATSQVMICDPGGVCTWSELKKSLDLSHSMAVNGLKVNTTYKYTTISKDSSGNEATAQGDLTTGAKAADTVPPSISGIAVTGITHSGAVIKWTSSEAATSQVEYGTTTAYGSASPLDSKLVTSHTVTLSGLSPDTTYHIMIRSKDSAGNEAVTRNDETFKTPPAVAVGLGVGNQPPDFALRNLAGQTVTLSEFRGKIVLINFWATWCGPCVGEMPDLQRIYETWPRDKLAILAIALRQGETEIQPFIADRGYTFPVLLDTAGTTSAAYAITSIPKTFFVDSAGIIRAVQNGAFGTSGQIETILNSIH